MKFFVCKRSCFLYVFICLSYITNINSQTIALDSLKLTLDTVEDNKGKLTTLLKIASVNKDSLRDSAEAYIYYEKARILAVKLKDTANIRTTIYNLGEILLEMEEYDMAIMYFDRVKTSLLKAKEPSEMLALVYKNLGESYLKKEDYVAADSFFDKGVLYAETIGNIFQKALNHLYKSEVYYKLEDYASSERQISQAFALFGEDKAPMMAYFFRGKLLRKLGDYQSAIANFKKTIDLAASENNITVKSKTLQLLANTYLASGDKKNALDYSKNALRIVDSLNDINKRTALSRIGYIHAFEAVMDKNNEKELKKNEEERKEKKNRMIMYGVISFIGLLFVAFFVYRQNKVMRMVADMRKAQIDLVEKKQQEYL